MVDVTLGVFIEMFRNILISVCNRNRAKTHLPTRKITEKTTFSIRKQGNKYSVFRGYQSKLFQNRVTDL